MDSYILPKYSTTARVKIFTSASKDLQRITRSLSEDALLLQGVSQPAIRSNLVASAASQQRFRSTNQSLQQHTKHTKAPTMSTSTKAQTVKEVEDKFGNYWPRNILILFGPPGLSLFLRLFRLFSFWKDCCQVDSFPFLPSNSLFICSFWKGNARAQD